MDLAMLIQELRDERNKLDQAIRTLEAIRTRGSRPAPSGRRGRKSMDADERLAVAERMRRYWAERKAKPSDRKATHPTVPIS